jgi:hypothetical protein
VIAFLAAWAICCAAVVLGACRFANWQRRDVTRITRWGREAPVHAETLTRPRSSATHNAAIDGVK